MIKNLAAFLIMLLAASGAFATCKSPYVWDGSGCTIPTAPPAASSSSSSGANAGATAGAAAGANAGAGAASDQRQSQGLTTNDSSSTRVNMWAIPAAPFLPQMSPVECPSASIRQTSITTPVWGLFGTYQWSSTDASACEMITVRNAMIERCRYASAAQVEDLLVKRTLQGFEPVTPVTRDGATESHYIDLTDQECALLKLPAAKHEAVPMTSGYAATGPACETKPAPRKRRNGGQPKKLDDCKK